MHFFVCKLLLNNCLACFSLPQCFIEKVCKLELLLPSRVLLSLPHNPFSCRGLIWRNLPVSHGCLNWPNYNNCLKIPKAVVEHVFLFLVLLIYLYIKTSVLRNRGIKQVIIIDVEVKKKTKIIKRSLRKTFFSVYICSYHLFFLIV